MLSWLARKLGFRSRGPAPVLISPGSRASLMEYEAVMWIDTNGGRWYWKLPAPCSELSALASWLAAWKHKFAHPPLWLFFCVNEREQTYVPADILGIDVREHL